LAFNQSVIHIAEMNVYTHFPDLCVCGDSAVRDFVAIYILIRNLRPIRTRNAVLLAAVVVAIESNATIREEGSMPTEFRTDVVRNLFTMLVTASRVDAFGIAPREEPTSLCSGENGDENNADFHFGGDKRWGCEGYLCMSDWNKDSASSDAGVTPL